MRIVRYLTLHTNNLYNFIKVSRMSSGSPKALICPSLLAADMSSLAAESARIIDAGADVLHLDVMDGHFVPNLTFGAPIISSLRKTLSKTHPDAVFDVHLMVTHPQQWVDDMAAAGANIFTFHSEVNTCGNDFTPLIEQIKSKGMKAGLAIKPNTPASAVYPYLHLLDLVLVMTVEPGFGGQSFMHDCMEKVTALRQHPDCHCSMDIEVDGGLSTDTVQIAAKAGANMIVAGSSVFKSADPAATISTLKNHVQTLLQNKEQQE